MGCLLVDYRGDIGLIYVVSPLYRLGCLCAPFILFMCDVEAPKL